MAGAIVSNKTWVAGLGKVGLSKGSARIAYLTKAQIHFEILAIGIRNIAAEATGERRVGSLARLSQLGLFKKHKLLI
jgi:hypothetical protein